MQTSRRDAGDAGQRGLLLGEARLILGNGRFSKLCVNTATLYGDETVLQKTNSNRGASQVRREPETCQTRQL